MAGKKHEEPSFGSDSFLDVITNMVGIIVILIVLVGLRVRHGVQESQLKQAAAQQARHAADQEANRLKTLEWEKAKAQIDRENDRRRQQSRDEFAEREKELARRQAVERRRQESLAKQAELIHQHEREAQERRDTVARYERETDRLRAEAAALAEKAARVKSETESQRAAAQDKEAELIAKQKDVDRWRVALDYESQRREKYQRSWDELRREFFALRDQLESIKAKPKVTKTWRHYATPIARRVQQKELHFRCVGGRVANIHLEALLDRCREAIFGGPNPLAVDEKNVVGPINGFRLAYGIARPRDTWSEQALNPFVVRVQLTGWRIIGESDRLGETEQEALASGSKFIADLLLNPPEQYAITLWVYPDSFPLATALRARLHEMGYSVALRPLPKGVPIAGSPFGSASRVQ